MSEVGELIDAELDSEERELIDTELDAVCGGWFTSFTSGGASNAGAATTAFNVPEPQNNATTIG
jgi:hypothetical protein